MPSLRRIVVLLSALSLLLTLSGVWAASPPAKSERPARVAQQLAPASLLSRAWSLVTSLWSEEGCNVDPDSRCVTAPAPTHAVPALTDTGCNVDPNGRCRS